MKILVIALIACAAGAAAGYAVRSAVVDDRVQTNLSKLSGASLARLDELSGLTHGFKKEDVDAIWSEWKRIERDYPAPESIEYASRAYDAALVYREVERVGWEQYRHLIRQNSEQFLGWRPSLEKLGQKTASPILLKRIEAAESEIIRTFPELKEKRANQSLEPTSVLGTSAAEPPRVPSTLVAHL